ncbi:hypothetical protein NDU88_002856 [Pleurodeles waltl]|uniref:Uncharacterized protein n=1 Tax=Pleurodeles waltl TaxID=8319 RepID=A0AAV7Q861_PLEWA|nr:hypothetical protein NDU88_002856 [Pleurodeles waltl]
MLAAFSFPTQHPSQLHAPLTPPGPQRQGPIDCSVVWWSQKDDVETPLRPVEQLRRNLPGGQRLQSFTEHLPLCHALPMVQPIRFGIIIDVLLALASALVTVFSRPDRSCYVPALGSLCPGAIIGAHGTIPTGPVPKATHCRRIPL